MAQKPWTFDDLTPEELAEYQKLEDDRAMASAEGDYDKEKELEQKINAFLTRMDRKYNR